MGKQLVNLSLAAASRMHPFCNLQSRARTHAVLVIGLYELLGKLIEPPGPTVLRGLTFARRVDYVVRVSYCFDYYYI
jgi:hypothetical protein